MKRKTLEVLFLEELADIYDCEIRLTRALPKMVRTATHAELRDAFQTHLDETEQQVERVKDVFESFGKSAKGKKCEAIVGLIKEADQIASDNKGCPTINAALICAAQKVEHYEIASYGCLAEWADQLGNDEAADLLRQTLGEEKAADKALTALARLRCNESAQDGASEEEDAPRMGRGRVVRPARDRARAW
jgi:ferritin-like metal-binding protein YciE